MDFLSCPDSDFYVPHIRRTWRLFLGIRRGHRSSDWSRTYCRLVHLEKIRTWQPQPTNVALSADTSPYRRSGFGTILMPRGLLENRTLLILAVLFFAFNSVWSWLSIRRVQLPENPASIFGLVNIFFYALLIFALVSIAFRSRFWGDRVVFGIVAGVTVLVGLSRASKVLCVLSDSGQPFA